MAGDWDETTSVDTDSGGLGGSKISLKKKWKDARNPLL
jgi:hypothetical protein